MDDLGPPRGLKQPMWPDHGTVTGLIASASSWDGTLRSTF
ncbi:hypothetical protein BN2537_14589 [Streptomyces venezuelae]|nr:hypothetical protein BN2537_14589 [Streptomyces venezuelae]